MCGSPRIVEGSLCRFSVEGGVLVVDRGLQVGGAVTTLVVVEAVAPVDHHTLGLSSGGEVVSGQHLPLQAGEERLGSGVVPSRNNAVIESCHSTLEFELRRLEDYTTRAEARAGVAAFIDDYNQDRRHSALNMRSPIGYELSA